MEGGEACLMSLKLFGAALIVVGCGGFGFLIAASYKQEENALRQLIGILDLMQSELQFRMTPLPDLIRQAGTESKNPIGQFMTVLSSELESQTSPDVDGCVQAALNKVEDLPKRVKKALEQMGTSFGRFDAEGQIRGIESVRSFCAAELDAMADNRDARLRSYQTLSLCMGAALAILFI